MLVSELEERERRFKLALRAGVPILLLIFLVFYALFMQDRTFEITLTNAFLLTSIIFITIYFNYFMMNTSVKESILDATTQSFNEKAFTDKLDRYKPKTIVLLIIKNLSIINDNYNAKKIDLLLYTIIQELNSTLRQYGLKDPLIGRRYGAEFLIALNQEGYDVKNIFDDFIKTHTVINNIEIDYSFAAATNTTDNIEQILEQLKDLIASTQSKKSTLSNVQAAKSLNETETSIINAVNSKRIKLTFRPLLNTKNNNIEIYELATKLMSETQQEILPRIFLPVINRLSLGIKYDISLVEHIVKLLPLVDKSISFTFNVSPFSLRNKEFQSQFFSLLSTHEVEASRLIIQLYERKTHHDLSGYFKTLTTYRAKGVRICIDNFGSSNASMEYMKHFKFDMVQFDRDYVTNLKDSTNITMLSSLITMSKELNILTVAKWVDKDTQKNTLNSLGIDYLQGFGIAHPLSENQLINKYN